MSAVAVAAPPGGSWAMRLLARQRWWLARVAMLPVHLLAFAMIVFFLVRLVPGDPAVTITRGQGTPEELERIRESLGLTGSLWDQFLAHLGRMLTLDFGVSISTRRDVLDDILARLPQTLELTFMALVVALALAVVLSAFAVFRPRGITARIANGYARAAGALPDFCLGILGVLVFYVVLRFAPAPIGRLDSRFTEPPRLTGLPFLDTVLSGDLGAVGSALAHLALPIAAMSIAYAPYLMKQLIPSLDAEARTPATRFRVASGTSRGKVMVAVFRRAFPSVVIVLGSMIGGLIGGAVVIESLFSLGGIGQYAVDAIAASDYPAIQGVLIVTVAVVLVVFLIVDLVVMALDPRRRAGRIVH